MKTEEDIAWLPEGTIVTCPHGNLAGEYTVLRQQNRGTSGLVYQVQSNRTGEIHALKEFYVKGAVRLQDLTLRIPETTEAGTLKELFMDEPVAFTQSEAWTNDDHDGLAIPRSEVFVWQGNSYYLMDWAEGISLCQWMKSNALHPEKGRPVTLDQCLRILTQLGDTIRRLHDKGWVHLDIAPQNIMVHTDDEENIHVKLVDFGLMRTLESFGSEPSIAMRGTPGFSDLPWEHESYERILKDTDSRHQIRLLDIYAMGAMIAYLCMLPYKHVIHERDEIHMRNFLHEMRYHPDRIWAQVAAEYPAPEERTTIAALFRLAKQATDNNFDTRIRDTWTFLLALRAY